VLSDEHEARVGKFRLWLRSKRYSSNTEKVYTEALRVFLLWFNERDPADLEEDNIIQFNNAFILERKLSASYQNQVVNALKLYFSTIEHKTLRPEIIHRPKSPKLLPNGE